MKWATCLHVCPRKGDLLYRDINWFFDHCLAVYNKSIHFLVTRTPSPQNLLTQGPKEKHECSVLLGWNFADLQQTCKEPTLFVHK